MKTFKKYLTEIAAPNDKFDTALIKTVNEHLFKLTQTNDAKPIKELFQDVQNELANHSIKMFSLNGKELFSLDGKEYVITSRNTEKIPIGNTNTGKVYTNIFLKLGWNKIQSSSQDLYALKDASIQAKQ